MCWLSGDGLGGNDVGGAAAVDPASTDSLTAFVGWKAPSGRSVSSGGDSSEVVMAGPERFDAVVLAEGVPYGLE